MAEVSKGKHVESAHEGDVERSRLRCGIPSCRHPMLIVRAGSLIQKGVLCRKITGPAVLSSTTASHAVGRRRAVCFHHTER